MMKVLSLNTGTAKAILIGETLSQTGIYKQAATGPVQVGKLGFLGDVQVATKHHGGPDQAVYIYSQQDYDWWSAELGYALQPGTFGENLTLSDYGGQDFRIGDKLVFSEVMLELSAPRIPCATLAARMGDVGFVKRFRAARRPGVYARVLQEGRLQVGESASYERAPADYPTILERFESFYDKKLAADTIKRFLQAPIAERDRTELKRLLNGLG